MWFSFDRRRHMQHQYLRRALFFFFTYKVISNTLMLTLNEVLHTAQDDVHVIIFIIVVGNVNTVLG